MSLFAGEPFSHWYIALLSYRTFSFSGGPAGTFEGLVFQDCFSNVTVNCQVASSLDVSHMPTRASR